MQRGRGGGEKGKEDGKQRGKGMEEQRGGERRVGEDRNGIGKTESGA